MIKHLSMLYTCVAHMKLVTVVHILSKVLPPKARDRCMIPDSPPCSGNICEKALPTAAKQQEGKGRLTPGKGRDEAQL